MTRLKVAEWFAQGIEPAGEATRLARTSDDGDQDSSDRRVPWGCHRPLSSHRMERGQNIRSCRLPAGIRARQRASHVGGQSIKPTSGRRLGPMVIGGMAIELRRSVGTAEVATCECREGLCSRQTVRGRPS